MARWHSERGAALIMTLIVLVVAFSATLLVSLALSIELRSARSEAQRLRLAALVDSACAEALAALAQDPYAPGFGEHPLADGVIASVIGGIDDNERDVDLVARLGSLERRVRAHVVLSAGGPLVVDWQPRGIGPASPGD